VFVKSLGQMIRYRADITIGQSEQERQAAVIRAEGEGEAASIISSALGRAGEGLVQIRRLEAARDIALTLSKARNVTYLPAQGGNMLLQVRSESRLVMPECVR
jgi:prohibitin 1